MHGQTHVNFTLLLSLNLQETHYLWRNKPTVFGVNWERLVDTVNRIKIEEIINLTIYVTNVIHHKEHEIKRTRIWCCNKHYVPNFNKLWSCVWCAIPTYINTNLKMACKKPKYVAKLWIYFFNKYSRAASAFRTCIYKLLTNKRPVVLPTSLLYNFPANEVAGTPKYSEWT